MLGHRAALSGEPSAILVSARRIARRPVSCLSRSPPSRSAAAARRRAGEAAAGRGGPAGRDQPDPADRGADQPGGAGRPDRRAGGAGRAAAPAPTAEPARRHQPRRRRRVRLHGHPPQPDADQRERLRRAGRDHPERAGLALRPAQLARHAVLRQLRHPLLRLRDAVARGPVQELQQGRPGRSRARWSCASTTWPSARSTSATPARTSGSRTGSIPTRKEKSLVSLHRVPDLERPLPARLQLPAVVGRLARVPAQPRRGAGRQAAVRQPSTAYAFVGAKSAVVLDRVDRRGGGGARGPGRRRRRRHRDAARRGQRRLLRPRRQRAAGRHHREGAAVRRLACRSRCTTRTSR